jgi:SAM-dependent methyltransferase
VIYRDDLAYIHDRGFSEFAESAAAGVIELLASLLPVAGGEKGNTSAPLIVEAGCGTGILARELTKAGYDVLGFDASQAMVPLARRNAPRARFRRASFDAMRIPPCDAIIAMGEVLNYGTFDAVSTFVTNASRALRSGGVLLFDVAERGSYPAHDEHRSGGADWSVIAIKESDGVRLTRRVLTFRNVGGSIRRDEEVHELELYDRKQLRALLREHGFRTKIRRSYGTRRLPPGHAVYVAVRR